MVLLSTILFFFFSQEDFVSYEVSSSHSSNLVLPSLNNPPIVQYITVTPILAVAWKMSKYIFDHF